MVAGWERAIARVGGADRPEGAAFLVPDGLLLTCAHVIAGLVGQRDEQLLPPDAEVTVDFPLAAGGPRPMTARLVFHRPVAPDRTGDIAVLRLDGGPPADIAPLRLLAADDLAGQRWRAFGFPGASRAGAAKDAGIWTSGLVEGREGTGWWQLTADPDAPFVLAQGFSGGPIWIPEYAGVAGIIVAVEGDPRRRTGYALTVDLLAREWPPLREHLLAGNPYRDLRPFDERDAATFFGRDAEIARLVELVDRDNTPIVPVLGASGVGKSSLVSAGLLSRLAERGGYRVARVPHGLRGTAEELLAWALTSVDGPAEADESWSQRWRSLSDFLASGGDATAAVLRVLAGDPSQARLLLVVDQFEELMVDAPTVAAGLDTLLGTLTARRSDGSRAAQALVVMRVDFLRHLDGFPNLTEAWNATQFVVPPMTRDQLRDVIGRPVAGLGGIRFADGLIERLLDDCPVGAPALPLLEHTLNRLWEAQDRGELTMAAYQHLGGVGGALAGTAERTLWSRTDANEREALERVFVQLVRPGETLDAGRRTPDTRRVADRSQFSDTDWALGRRLATTRLLVVTRQPNGTDTIELTHEALIGAWPRLAGWIAANRAFRTWQEGLRRALRVWREADRDQARLLGRAEVADAEPWVRQRAAQIPADEREFITLSAAARARARRRRRTGWAAAATVVVLGLVAGVVAVQQYGAAQAEHGQSVSHQIAVKADEIAATNPELAAQLYLAAYRAYPTTDLAALLATAGNSALPSPPSVSAEVDEVAFSPDGRILAAASSNQIQLWNVTDPAHVTPLGDPLGALGTITRTVAFSPDGRVLARGGTDGEQQASIELWNVADPSHAVLAGRMPAAEIGGGGSYEIVALAFSPNGHLLASGSDESVNGSGMQLWDVTDPARPKLRGPGPDAPLDPTDALAYSPNGRTLAVGRFGGNLGSIHLVDVSNPEHPVVTGSTLTIDTPAGNLALAYSPDGRTVAAGSGVFLGGAIQLWNVSDPARPARWGPAITIRTGVVNALTFGPSGILASGQNDGTIRLWDIADPAHPTPLGQPLYAINDAISSLALSPDGNLLADGTGFSSIGLWDMNPDHAITRICASSKGALTAAIWHQYFPSLAYQPPCG